jgi:hypothetical protein
LKDYPDFWLKVLSNHRIIKDFISDEDIKILKNLKDIRYEKYNDGMVSKYLALNIKIFYIFFLKKEFKNYF